MQFFGSELSLHIDWPRLHIIADKKNPKAVDLGKQFEQFSSNEPNLNLVCGGDGYMLEALHRYQHLRLPFLGLNAGHRGYLLNEPDTVSGGIPSELKIYTLPLLEVEIVLANGKVKRMVAFNDVWIERAASQAAWIEIKVNGVLRLKKLVSDGALIATPAGSTAYARSMGTFPVPLDAQVLVLAGSNVFEPELFRPCYLPIWSTVELATVDKNKRPVVCMVDGIRVGKVHSLKVSVSRTASVQLANIGQHSLPEKLLSLQFPQGR